MRFYVGLANVELCMSTLDTSSNKVILEYDVM